MTAAVRSIGRALVLRAVFAVLPRRLDAEVASDLEAAVEFRIRGRDGRAAGRYRVAVSDGRCAVERGAGAPADAVFTLGVADLLRLAAGTVRWYDLLGSGRLELAGDPFVAMRVPALFRLSPSRPAMGGARA